ncbi:MAG TPA: VCBS repeat-containing protein [Candidatus Limnocylindrales bacterium]
MFGLWGARRWASGLVVLTMVVAMGEPVSADTVVKVPNSFGTFDASVLGGDFNGDGRADLALTGATTWKFVPVALSNGDGSFDLRHTEEDDRDHARFAMWAAVPGAQILTGDFDGDGRTDLALTGASSWSNVPVAFSNGDGTFKVTSEESPDFASWASEPGVTVTTGDFNEDRRTDVVLTPGPRSEWAGPAVALSNGDGTFEVKNEPLKEFAELVKGPGVKVTSGDFNRDGLTDLVLVPGPESELKGLPVVLSNGDGTFEMRNEPLDEFADLARLPGMRVDSGDFNGDGLTDVVLIPGPESEWRGVPAALSNGDGGFELVNEPLEEFADLAREPGVRVNSGDFNGDGRTDLALTGGAKWDAMPVAFSNEGGRFEVALEPLKDFASWAQEPGVKVVSGDFDANGATDMVLTGVVGWTTVPVVWSNIEGHFVVTNAFLADFPLYAAPPGPDITYPGTWYGKPYGLIVNRNSITVNWFDRSNNERGFRVDKRNKQGNWQEVHRVPTRNMLGSGSTNEQYTWVDTSHDISGQCYRIGAYNETGVAFTPEKCAVRPDPNEFPQHVPPAAKQWTGLSSANDGTGRLHNHNGEADVVYGDRDWGVNLVWADTSLWRVQAQGGPNLMKGQAVAIRVWGGGWLRKGHQTFGVDLVLDSNPSYEWYVLSESNSHPTSGSTMSGDPLGQGGHFALWNSTAGEYLVHGSQTWGINLKWWSEAGSEPPPPPPPPQTSIKTLRVINCSWPDEHTLQLWVKDLTAGSAWTHVGSVQPNWNDSGSCGPTTFAGSPFNFNVPISGHYYELVAVDSDPDWCFLAEPNPNIAFNCVRMETAPFLGSTTSSVVATVTVN